MQETKDKVMPTKTIVVKIENYQALDALKMIPQEPFDSVIKRLLDRNTDLIKTMPNDNSCLLPDLNLPAWRTIRSMPSGEMPTIEKPK